VLPAEAPDDLPDEPAAEESEGVVEAEPWYFTFIWFFAHLILILSLAVFGIGLLLSLAFLLTQREPALFWGGTLSLLAWELTVIFGCALILLVMDMARSFRALRTLERRSDRQTRALRAIARILHQGHRHGRP
jgi:hypothetical protein